MVDIPQPKSRRPWWRKQGKPAIYDQDGEVVAFVENGEWCFFVDACHDPLKTALYTLMADYLLAATVAGFNPELIAAALAPVKEALAMAGVKVRS